MRRDSTIEWDVNSTACRRWIQIALCLLFALGMLLHLGHDAPVQASTVAIQVANTGDLGAEPCEPGHASAGELCHAASVCPLFVPATAQVVVFDGTSSRPLPDAGTLMLGRVIGPDRRPPRLPLLV